MNASPSCARGLAAMALLIVWLGACQTGPPPRQALELAKQQAAERVAQGDLAGAAEIYWAQADKAEPAQAQSLRLRAVEVLLTPETAQLARDYRSRIDESELQGALLVRKRLVDARLALFAAEPERALQVLPPSMAELAPELGARVQMVRASALADTGRLREAVMTRFDLARKLDDPQLIEANREALWGALAQATPRQLNAWAGAAEDDQALGWLALAYVAKTSPRERAGLERLLMRWRERFPGHPAAQTFSDRVRAEWKELQMRPAQIAVLLPMTGRYAAPSKAILAGLTSAFYSANDNAYTPRLKLYDTGDKPYRVHMYYDRAVAEGADMVVGPLDKRAVRLLARRDKLPVPVLTLNYMLDTDIEPPPGLYQFGLLPEDEARQVAERGFDDGHRGALVFAPKGEWGTRLVSAFRARFRELGGRVLDVERFDAGDADFSAAMERALELDESAARRRALEKTLARDLKFVPHRRRDADMAFLAVSPSQARLMRPQFKFHYAAELPLYATSHVYSGARDARSDRDIDGIVYCEIPWLLDALNPKPKLHARLERLFPSATRGLPRLVALGFDAMRVVPRLKRLQARPYEHYTGLTGDVSVDARGRLHRRLGWAHFVDGEPRALGERRTARAEP